ncbi:carboxypeptidase-like regulatory domain-containing protein [Elizabethkingia anophelis]|nr:carboxypeptidase-like regulatory domain-containing protein [Elizabethkingia anophelis]MCS7372928.1 carboxypeptidase-like regulatory domain-containing protein [Elizabethkingia anophelis]MCS7378050.1 carboxypeptidase-like regulatory domain-containing protein [Elizabethkingia anophelis]MCS7390413.1 carboxypeptidase-like regulatory domain-containing protein [Elizabethkingia anophelis]WJK01046.1 carboxypeptidase-like regulatory domain-containing protein [Elizabethkingia anophelis]
MRKTFLLFTIFFIFSNSLFSQDITGRLLSKDMNPIQQVVVGVEGKNVGAISNDKGIFSINLSNQSLKNNIIITANGYESYKISIEDFIKQSNHDIILNERVIEIPEVNISSKRYILKNWGNNNINRAYTSFDSNKSKQIMREIAVKFDNKKPIRINKINVGLFDYTFEDSITLIFNVYNSINKLPGETLSPRMLKVVISKNDIKNKTISIDVSKYNIWTNSDFYVSMRVADDFKGKLQLGGNIYAFTKDTYYRYFYDNWNKYSMGVPAINVDIQINN